MTKDLSKVIEISENDYDFGMKKFNGSKAFKINSLSEIRQSTDNGSTLKINYDISNSSNYIWY